MFSGLRAATKGCLILIQENIKKPYPNHFTKNKATLKQNPPTFQKKYYFSKQ